MATTTDLLFRPALELAALVRNGELSARELVAASLERIDAVNPELNAFVDVFHDEALAAAGAIHPGDERRFAGVPIAVKNNRAIEGRRLTFCSPFTGDFAAPYDHIVVKRLRAAGFVIVGSTTLPEWGILPWTYTKRFGATRNPWDPARTSGGSSGGSAPAVAAGMVPIAHANDGGGSTRIPAACCGLVGLKPQRNRVSLAPEIGQSFLATDGVLSRTVADTAAALDALAGPEVGDAAWAPPPRPPAPLPGSPAQGGGGAPPPWRRPRLGELFTALFAPLVMGQVAAAAALAGREPGEGDMEPLSLALWRRVAGMSALEAQGAAVQLERFARELLEWMQPYDVLVAPALAEAPLILDTVHWDTDDPMGLFTRSAAFTPFTAVANVSGQPAISVPLFEHEGLPVAAQLFGRPAREGDLLAVAAQLEAARPWADRRPPVP